MNVIKLKTALTIAHAAQDHVHCVGAHGMGKTEIVKQWAKENNYHIEVLQLPILEVADLVGMPIIEDTKYGKVTSWAAPEWIMRIHEANSNGKHCIIFADELGRASADIRNASLQMVLEGTINSHSCGELDGLKSLWVVADNDSDEYDTAEFDMALEDRFQSYHVEAGVDEWLKYARINDVISVVSDYIAEMPEKLQFKPETDNDKGSSPRAWKKLSDGLKVCKDDTFIYSLIVSKIGKTVGANFHHFYNNYTKVVKPEDIMKIIGDTAIVTEKAQRAMAKKLGKLTKSIEVISANELGMKMKKLASKGKIPNEAVLVYVASLNLESAAGFLKSLKNSSEKSDTEFYYGAIQTAQDKRWFSKELIANVKN